MILNNALAVYKVALLVFIVFIGFAAMAGARRENSITTTYDIDNLKDALAGASSSLYWYANAILGTLFGYQGWENANYVLGEVRVGPGGDPTRTYRRAALVSFSTVSIFYVLANVAYFTVGTRDEIISSDINVAARFFIKVGRAMSITCIIYAIC